MTKYEIVVGFEETGRIQFFGYPKLHSAMWSRKFQKKIGIKL